MKIYKCTLMNGRQYNSLSCGQYLGYFWENQNECLYKLLLQQILKRNKIKVKNNYLEQLIRA